MRATALLLSIVLATAADNARAMQLLDAWIDAADRHSAGARDEPLTQIAAWTLGDLDLLQGYVEALIDARLNSPARVTRRRQISGSDLAAIRQRTLNVRQRGTFDAFLKRAVMLHTDAALLESLPQAKSSPTAAPQQRRNRPGPPMDVMSSDGRVERFEIANPHWQFAMDLLDALPAAKSPDPIVAQWYRSIGAHFAREHSYGDAMRHFDRARKTVPDDPGVLFGEACLQETLGSPPQQNFVRLTTLPNGLTILGVEAPQTHFRRAEDLLTRAVAAKPDFPDARLRLGRVIAEQRRYDAALPHFARVIAESRDPVLVYYAHLFAGDAALALGRPAESRASYERALSTFPDAQAARLGLAAALRAAGHREAARDAVMTTITVEPNTRDASTDPWWEYYEGDAANVQRLLDELRAPFRSRGW